MRAWAIDAAELAPRAAARCVRKASGSASKARLRLDDRHPVAGVADAGDVDGEGEAVEQLRAQVAFLGVHRADQDEAGRVGEGDALALDDVHAHGGRVEQHVDHVVVEQVDLVDVEQAAVGGGQDAGLEVALALLDGLLDVERADDAVFGGGDGQVDEGDGFFFDGQGRRRRRPSRGTRCTRRRAGRGRSRSGSPRTAWTLGQQGGQGAGGGGLGRAAFAADQHAADAGVNGVEDQGAPHALLADDGSEGVDGGHDFLRSGL